MGDMPSTGTPTPTNNSTGVSGVGGWLLFFCVSITILSPIIAVVRLIIGWAESIEILPIFPNTAYVLVADTVLSIGLIGFAIFAGVRLWSVKPRAVRTAKIFLICMLCYNIFSPFLIYLAGFPESVNREALSDYGSSLIRDLIYFAIWFAYLSASKRVNNTYAD